MIISLKKINEALVSLKIFEMKEIYITEGPFCNDFVFF